MVKKEKEEKQADVDNVKSKRGRKSKKTITNIISNEDVTNTNTNITLSVDEIHENTEENEQENVIDSMNKITDEMKPIAKKRGRKPKGGKIIQQVIPIENQKIDKPNVILHLKCSMKDLQNSNGSNTYVETFNFSNKHELNYDLLEQDNIITITNPKSSNCIQHEHEYEDDNDDVECKDSNKEIWKKLKQLEHNLHINNVNNKKSACFWDTCDFDSPPVYIPKHFINGTYHVYGCFCSPECGVAYLMNENIDSSTKFERYHLFNHIYAKIYDYQKNIKPAPNPYYMLEKYYGNLSIQEYRSLLRNERLFLIVDKPLTRILPELHEDNDEFILNNKIIPSNNNYQLKTRLQRKKPTKPTIFNEKFSMNSSVNVGSENAE
jgi:hypothetical protein